jgi:glycosyltransferase involved in cell wall biosynthesis
MSFVPAPFPPSPNVLLLALRGTQEPPRMTAFPAGALGASRAADPDAHVRIGESTSTLLCVSHLRWNFVYQRPQHLMSRFARTQTVLYFEEPVDSPRDEDYLDVRQDASGVWILVPHLFPGRDDAGRDAAQRALLDRHLARSGTGSLTLWYYTPMALSFTRHLARALTVYDCMDELSAFRFAPPQLLERESELLDNADVVFTGGHSLYEAKRERHPRVHAFPSSVDVAHFATARGVRDEPEDQRGISRPRLGFFGVIDERFDVRLIETLAGQHPDWQIVLIGPVVKIDPSQLPRSANLHYLGPKRYEELPRYLGGWDVAIMPFALNASTRFISPTKTPEYLAGGIPVVSTPVRDVVLTYGDSGVVHIGGDPTDFAAGVEKALSQSRDRPALLALADRAIGQMSWDATWNHMKEEMRRG